MKRGGREAQAGDEAAVHSEKRQKQMANSNSHGAVPQEQVDMDEALHEAHHHCVHVYEQCQQTHAGKRRGA